MDSDVLRGLPGNLLHNALDETLPGSGLVLAIADKLVRLGGGSLLLAVSPHGGLRVSLMLPQWVANPAATAHETLGSEGLLSRDRAAPAHRA